MRVFPSLEAQLKHRLYVTEGVEIRSIYDRYQNLLGKLYAQEGLPALVLLEQKLLDLSLNEAGSSTHLEEALISVSPHRRRTFASAEEAAFLRALYEALHGVWLRPPWCYSDHVVYDATRKMYSDEHLIVEIAYGTFNARAPSTASPRIGSYP